MTPVEKLQAAIERLEELYAAATEGAWVYDADIGGEVHAVSDAHGGGSAFIARVSSRDGKLIATLHHTIDAQLAILHHVLGYATARVERGRPTPEWSFEHTAVALADAILGES